MLDLFDVAVNGEWPASDETTSPGDATLNQVAEYLTVIFIPNLVLGQHQSSSPHCAASES